MIFTYMIGAIIVLLVWIAFFLHKHSLGRQMLAVDFMLAILGILGGIFLWTVDWWHPETITGTVVGIENFILGFGYGGVASVMYQVLAGKTLARYKKISAPKKFLVPVSGIAATLIIFLLGAHAFYASVIGMLVPVAVIYFYRRDLIGASVFTGVVTVAAAFAGS